MIYIIRRSFFVIVTFIFVFFANSLTSFAADKQNYDVLMPAAKKYIGVPYKFGGTDASGFDCSGFVRHVFNQVNVSLPRTTAEQYNTGTAVAKENLRIGDMVFFETYKPGASHSGIYIGNSKFIHADSTNGISVSSLEDPYYWGPRYLGAKRMLSYEKEVGIFQDIPSSFWAYEEIKTLADDNLLLGMEDSYFHPDQLITKAEVAGLLAVSLKLDMNNRKKGFDDVSTEHWALGAINALKDKGYITGDDANNFQPNAALTREQLAVWFTKAFSLEEASTPVEFADVDSSYWAYDQIQRLAAAGISTGDEDNNFRPTEEIDRAQFAAFLYRALY
ncbi:S-layer homology domain-containing protein [Cytobacillus sp. IB215665]|uniref:C40 family peptidase n=1 Tax=Cytobacillus sp. IB215665 TaxID=3097357 RepID=UPI002A14E246|nr:S-layer homology domain-containing protein [Cytobacillus sp. IB215665]MDX8363770.1 S-layer homology domain-containing protein [Cytobacillus sp. IB215665]